MIGYKDYTYTAYQELGLPDKPDVFVAFDLPVELSKLVEFGFWTASAICKVGITPRTILQLEPKPGTFPTIVEATFGCREAHDNTLVWRLMAQHKRCSDKPAKLVGLMPEERLPDVFAWRDGPCESGDVELFPVPLNQRATCRVVPTPQCLPPIAHPGKLGIVAALTGLESNLHSVRRTYRAPVLVTVVGRNTELETPERRRWRAIEKAAMSLLSAKGEVLENAAREALTKAVASK
jgi:hypothetical protein